MGNRTYIVPLEIDPEAYQRMYAGEARSVHARDSEGRSIEFPATALRRFITRDGIQGVFIIEVDANNKLIGVRRRS